jgi:hypothetical protein
LLQVELRLDLVRRQALPPEQLCPVAEPLLALLDFRQVQRQVDCLLG